jgi:adenine-specific DNA-methyltransferase
MGFRVGANDWEPYSYVINSCHLRLKPVDLDSLFPARGGVDAVLAELNALPPLPESEAYISRYYAPRKTEEADWKTERLFYTRENALAIDAIRERIEELHPGMPEEPASFLRKTALLAPLLYQAATHTNTSGVFKAYHKGFGGHGHDALGRIMGPIRLGTNGRPLLSRSSLRRASIWKQLFHAQHHCPLGQAAGEPGASARWEASAQGGHSTGLDANPFGILLS